MVVSTFSSPISLCRKCICLIRDRDLLCEIGIPKKLPINDTRFLDVNVFDCSVTEKELRAAFPQANVELHRPNHCHKAKIREHFLFYIIFIFIFIFSVSFYFHTLVSFCIRIFYFCYFLLCSFVFIV